MEGRWREKRRGESRASLCGTTHFPRSWANICRIFMSKYHATALTGDGQAFPALSVFTAD